MSRIHVPLRLLSRLNRGRSLRFPTGDLNFTPCEPFSVVVAALLLSAATASATAVWTVSTVGDGGPGSLRQAILDSADGDRITFGISGLIVLTNGELMITRNLTITGPGPKQLTISGNNQSRVFNIVTGIVQIAELTITAGFVQAG